MEGRFTPKIGLAPAIQKVLHCPPRLIRIGSHVSFYGHIGDSILHIAVSVADATEADLHDIDAIVYQLIKTFAGAVSAEHGIGTPKRDFLRFSRSRANSKSCGGSTALDPNGIFNPGKVLTP